MNNWKQQTSVVNKGQSLIFTALEVYSAGWHPERHGTLDGLMWFKVEGVFAQMVRTLLYLVCFFFLFIIIILSVLESEFNP